MSSIIYKTWIKKIILKGKSYFDFTKSYLDFKSYVRRIQPLNERIACVNKVTPPQYSRPPPWSSTEQAFSKRFSNLRSSFQLV